MFSKSITTSDAFREMPASSQALYFHLGMEADDDGFLDNYRGMMRSINASDDDFKILIGKRFLILFPSKVVVVKHWKINNDIKKDRYHETKHLEEKRALIIKENGAYTECEDMDTERIQDVSKLETQYRIGKDRIVGATRIEISPSFSEEEKEPKAAPKYPHAHIVSAWFPEPEPSWLINTTELKHMELLYARGETPVKDILVFVGKHRDDEYFPKVNKPSELERKWNDIQDYADRNGL